MKIGVADARADHLDETLAGLELGWLYDGDVALQDHGLFGPGHDSGELRLWDLVGHGE
jgi:hypothetical protein